MSMVFGLVSESITGLVFGLSSSSVYDLIVLVKYINNNTAINNNTVINNMIPIIVLDIFIYNTT